MIRLELLVQNVVRYEFYNFNYGEYDTVKNDLEIIKFNDLKYQKVDLNKYKHFKNPRVSNVLIDSSRTIIHYKEEILDAIANKEDIIMECKGDTENSVDTYKFIPISEMKEDILSFISENVELEEVDNTIFNNLLSNKILKAKKIDFNNLSREQGLQSVELALRNYTKSRGVELISIFGKKQYLSTSYSDKSFDYVEEFGKACHIDRSNTESIQRWNRIDKYPKSLVLYNPGLGTYTYIDKEKFHHKIQVVLGAFKKIDTRTISL